QQKHARARVRLRARGGPGVAPLLHALRTLHHLLLRGAETASQPDLAAPEELAVVLAFAIPPASPRFAFRSWEGFRRGPGISAWRKPLRLDSVSRSGIKAFRPPPGLLSSDVLGMANSTPYARHASSLVHPSDFADDATG